MSVDFVLNAEARPAVGKGASRRLRRAGRFPVALYGGKKDPENLSLPHDDVFHQLQNEAFYSTILQVKIGERIERAILRDLQRHPFKPLILHMDLQRVSEDQPIRVHVPIHFVNEATCRGVKQEGGAISHLMIEVEVACLPKDLPEYIEVDVADLGLGQSLHLSAIKAPEGVVLVPLSHGNDPIVVNVHHVRATEAATGVEAAEGEAGATAGEPTGS